MLKGLLFLINAIWRLMFVVILTISLIAAMLLVAFQYLPRYPNWVEEFSGHVLGKPLQLTRVETAWQGWMPTLILHDVHLLGQAQNQAQHVAQLHLRLDLIASALEQRFVSDNLLLRVENLDTVSASGDFGITSAQQEWLDWLLQQNQVEIQLQRLNVKQTDALQTFSNVRLLLVREGLHHRFHVRADLSPLTWLTLGEYQLRQGRIEANALASWAENELVGIRGDFNLQQLDISGPDGALDELDRLHSRFSLYQAERNNWRLDVEDFSLRANGVATQAASFSLDQWHKTGFKLRLSALHLGRWFNLLGALNTLPVAWRNALAVMQPDGQLDYLEWRHKRSEWQLELGLKQWQNQAWLTWPGLKHVGFTLELSPHQGKLTFAEHNLELSLPALYSAAWPINQLRGALRWEMYASGWQIHSHDELHLSTPDIQDLSLSGFVQVPDKGDAYADIKLKLSDLALPRVHSLVPDQVVSAKVINWLKNHLQAGRISEAQGLLSGPLKALPFKQDEGILQLNATVTDGHIQYGDNWPPATEITSEVRLTAQNIEIDVKQAKIHANPVQNTRVTIKDFTTPNSLVHVRGQSQTDAVKALDFVAASPLGIKLDFLRAQGPLRLDLDTRIPLHAGRKASVNGVVSFKNTHIEEAATGLGLDKVQGRLLFDDHSFHTKNVSGNLFGQATTVDVHSVAKPVAATQLSLQGSADKTVLRQVFTQIDKSFPYHKWLDNIDGKTSWQAELTIPKAKPDSAVLRIVSDLHGLRTGLPEPLSKQAHERHPLSVDIALHHDAAGREIQLRYADILQAIWYAGSKPMRGAVQFGESSTLSLPLQGLHIQGQLQRFPFTAWQALWPTQNSSGGETPLSLNLHIDQLELLGHYFHNARLYSQGKTAQKIYLQAQEIAGTLQRSPDTLKIELSHLVLRENAQAQWSENTASDIVPSQVPSLSIRCDDTYIHGIDLGQLRLETQAVKDGMELRQFSLSSADTQLDGRGYWLNNSGGQRTMLYLNADSTDVSATLKRFGFAEQPIASRQARMELSGSWPGSPTQFSLDQLTGNLHLDIDKGRLIKVEPGVGRIFGLFDLRIMPNRLVLDFNDLFAEGFSFDNMRGDFVFANGFAETDNLYIQGNAAHVNIYGRTGLSQRTFDQVVTVIPKASNALPIAGALVGGVGGGVAMWLVQQMVQNPIDQSLQIMYQVTGDWKTPVVTRLGQERETEATDQQ